MMDFTFINTVLYYVIIFVIIGVFWHYALPGPVKHEIKKLIKKVIMHGVKEKRERKAQKKREKTKPEPITERKPKVEEFSWEDIMNEQKEKNKL